MSTNVNLSCIVMHLFRDPAHISLAAVKIPFFIGCANGYLAKVEFPVTSGDFLGKGGNKGDFRSRVNEITKDKREADVTPRFPLPSPYIPKDLQKWRGYKNHCRMESQGRTSARSAKSIATCPFLTYPMICRGGRT